eukprot:CAMPEP_0197929556 /NCGR_PEP_ID=MMETSP1439-20131203/103997_1 /TAXON_ID=66791 /ORGANISM="Gonyaulax spinifera, Strain CCMP409" /LENGTH=81 /DNA_ID=CAMNT_0043552207 /DNA_START=155 /DNA_END=396 /DNA_ORIENTATION=+
MTCSCLVMLSKSSALSFFTLPTIVLVAAAAFEKATPLPGAVTGAEGFAWRGGGGSQVCLCEAVDASKFGLGWSTTRLVTAT